VNPTILIADDDKPSLLFLEKTLAKLGFPTIATGDGEEADRILRGTDLPHLAILDWEMPGLSGPEVCRRVRARRSPGYVYVILLTARQGRDELAHAFGAGVDDFLTKPLDTSTLRHRLAVGVRVVTSELQLVRQQEELAHVIRNLESLAEDRAMRMVHTERLATLGTLAAGVAHEINNPATFISGNLKILQDCWPVVDQALARHAVEVDDDRDQAEFVREEFPRIVQGALTGVDRILKIVCGLNNYSRKGNDQVAPFDLLRSLDAALTVCQNLGKHKVNLEMHLPAGPVTVLGDAQQIEQIFINLMSNAVDAMQEQESGTITITVRQQAGQALVCFDDTGAGFSPQVLDEIWKPFFTTKEPGKGTGLGLSIVQRIVRNHHGEIEASNRPEGGARFTVRLPLHGIATIGSELNPTEAVEARDLQPVLV
jgi:signal transduction histidine kinase